jgi:hypothetical protein
MYVHNGSVWANPILFSCTQFYSEYPDKPQNSCSYFSLYRHGWNLELILVAVDGCSFVEVEDNFTLSSEKLQKLGLTFRPIEETLRNSVESYRAFGILN